jgi:putative transposase
VPPATFYRWYDRYRKHGPEGLADRSSKPSRVWNRIPEPVRERLLALALEAPVLSARELSVRFTDTKKYFVSEGAVCRLLKTHRISSNASTFVSAGGLACPRHARSRGLPLRATETPKPEG